MNTLGFGINDWLHSVMFKPGNSDLAPSVDGLFMFILWVCIISFVILMVPMCWWSFVQYRRRPGVPQQRTPNHNTALEVTWIVVPLIIVVFIFFWGFHGYMAGQVARAGSEEIIISAKKWNWSATYDNGANSPETAYLDYVTQGDNSVRRGNIAFPIFVVPAGRPVKFKMSSQDVIHSFYIPDMRIKMDVFPNRYTSLTFTPLDNTGPSGAGSARDLTDGPSTGKDPKSPELRNIKYRDHFIFCAEYCGTNHSEMAGILRVVDKADYDKIKANWGNIDEKVTPAELGKIVWETQGCNSCHSVDGSKGTGPTWKNAYGYPIDFDKGEAIDWSKPDAWDNYIVESIRNPAARVHKGYANQMPVFTVDQLSQKRVEGLIAYFKALSDRGNTPAKSGESPAPAAAPKPQG